jgi:hypothetical protein
VGGQAASEGRFGIRSVPTNSYINRGAVCQLKLLVGNSECPFEQWTGAQNDGTYPRPEARGIAPVQHITEVTRSEVLYTRLVLDIL